jgi:hypothetical protein
VRRGKARFRSKPSPETLQIDFFPAATETANYRRCARLKIEKGEFPVTGGVHAFKLRGNVQSFCLGFDSVVKDDFAGNPKPLLAGTEGADLILGLSFICLYISLVLLVAR